MAFLKGTNNLDNSRSYYKGGFACEFSNGHLIGKYPCAVVDTTVEIVNPITANICNIADITHLKNPNTGSAYSIKIIYGKGCLIDNVETSNGNAYMGVAMDSCLYCLVDRYHFYSDQTNTTSNSYPVAFLNSSFCMVDHSNIYNKNWHATTTGDHYLCYSNKILNSNIVSDSQHSHGDHENAYGTTIINCHAKFGVDLAPGGKINGLILDHADNTYKHCLIRCAIGNNEGYNNYNFENITLNGATDANVSYCGIWISTTSGTGYTAGTKYLDNLNCNNIKTVNFGTKQPSLYFSCLATDTIIIGNVAFDNCDIAINGYDTTKSHYSFKADSLFSFINNHKWNGTNSYLLLNASRHIKRLFLDNVTVQGVSGTCDYLVFGTVRFYSAFAIECNNVMEGSCLKRLDGGAVAIKPKSTCVVNIDRLSYSGQFDKYNVYKPNSGTTLYSWAWVGSTMTRYKQEVGTAAWEEV